ncbi:sugar ABC transporter substrate-binding protein [Leptolyngbya sp. FACHB-711]|uniref:ABC transporter substrate-binding protein n=1 Tax=unclassified Leptolyngbya TaxID=2650499 RepID=UPI00168658EC|nr:sugar ABC transporter substrate-binding protein [Leptolyngbya sp. FACHB-711]MBD1848494.1 sugar ABC transporter substrate-binding protein [Cyanobacteria bacterium FACHB-502]MBD2025993.1 sugar ABC transporter substrate-binding protein [Leptolyngbya sp. FACHB-711]
MRVPRFAKLFFAMCVGFFLVQLHACSPQQSNQASGGGGGEQATLTIATVNNADMVVMQRLSNQFEKDNPNIDLNWVVLEENVLRQRVTNDIANKGGQFDVMTIGTYEAPIWGKQDWLRPLENLSADYDVNDILKPIRDALSVDGRLYALPFYGESSMLYYRKDLFQQAGITVPEQPTYTQIKEWAARLHNPNAGVYGICLRGKPGWGENTAFVTTMANAYGAKWFDANWNPQLTSPEWKAAVNDYVSMLKQYGPPGASSNGFNENLALFSTGKCGMWVDATVAAGLLSNPQESQVADTVGFARAPIQATGNGSNWLWAWSLGIPSSSKSPEAAQQFIEWATSKEYVQLVAQENGWVAVPPGTRASTYANAEYKKAAPFADTVLKSIESAQPGPTATKPYTGIQFVGIPEFQAIGTQVGQTLASALTGQVSVDQALQQAQSSTTNAMKSAGYLK